MGGKDGADKKGKKKAEKIDPKKTLTALNKKKGASAEKTVWNELINELSRVDGAALQHLKKFELDTKLQEEALDNQFKLQRETLEAQSKLGVSMPVPQVSVPMPSVAS